MTEIVIGIIVSAVLSAISYGVQAALAPTPRKPVQSGRIDALRSIAKDNTAPLRIVYGTFRASGVLLFARSTNAAGQPAVGGRFLHFCLAMAHGPIDDITEIQLNDEPADSAKFHHLVNFIPHVGAVDQPMFRGPVQLTRYEGQVGIRVDDIEIPEAWLRKYRPLRQVAYLWGVLRHDPDVFPGGAPNVRATMRGRILYDPREDVSQGGWMTISDTSTHRWSRNWATPAGEFVPRGGFFRVSL